MRFMGWMEHFFIYACVGVIFELFFVGIKNLLFRDDAGLHTETTLWMFPIYGSMVFLFEPFYQLFRDYPLFFRLFLYGVFFLFAEYMIGMFLTTLCKRRPWTYTTRWHVHHLIRLDYIFNWMFFGYLIEKLYLFLLLKGF